MYFIKLQVDDSRMNDTPVSRILSLLAILLITASCSSVPSSAPNEAYGRAVGSATGAMSGAAIGALLVKSPFSNYIFPDPIPMPSARMRLPEELVHLKSPDMTLGKLSALLDRALIKAKIEGECYYLYRDGFALATRIEQIDITGSSLASPDRYSVDVAPLRRFDLKALVSRLSAAPPGYYRCIVFIVCSEEITFKNEALTKEDADDMYRHGSARLPKSREDIRCTGYVCFALIYNFHRESQSLPIVADERPITDAEAQLNGAGVLAALAATIIP